MSELAGRPVSEGEYGYTLIEGYLVPNAFIEKVLCHIDMQTFEYGQILNPKEMVGNEFWDSLNYYEQEILGSCLLFMIECGFIWFHLPGKSSKSK
jgi:hypothetical protein